MVAKITPLGNTNNNAVVKAYNSIIPDLVSARVAAGKHIVVVDLNSRFPMSEMLSDGIHPNQMGYEWMADRWYEAIGALLPQ